MAHKARQQSIDVRSLLLQHGQKIPFVQVLRLLRYLLFSRQDDRVAYANAFDYIRVRPELGLDFPGTDVVKVDEINRREKSLFRVTAAFMGLYGPSSPLPTFYTEDLLDERREDKSITRDFLDIFNQPYYQHYFDIWEKYTLGHQLAENPQSKVYDYLYSLLGLSGELSRRQLPDSKRFLSYIGIASQAPHSASGLRSIISDVLSIDSVEVEQCVSDIAAIPVEQYCKLGEMNCVLGEEAHLGSQVSDIAGKFRIVIGPVSDEQLQTIIPDTLNFELIHECVKFYLDQPLNWDLKIEVKKDDIQTCQPGKPCWGKLGWNTWLFSGEKNYHNGQVPLSGSGYKKKASYRVEENVVI